MTRFTGVVLTGGASRRMGTDKALLEIGGIAMARRVGDALAGAGATEVVAVGGDAAGLARLGLPTVADDHPGHGPLAAVVTALAHAVDDVVVVLACDLPSVSADLVGHLVSSIDEGDHDAAVVLVDDVPQVLTAAYRRRCRAPLADAFADGERSLRRALDRLDVVWVTEVDRVQLRDVDRPGDLHRYALDEPRPANGSSGGRT